MKGQMQAVYATLDRLFDTHSTTEPLVREVRYHLWGTDPAVGRYLLLDTADLPYRNDDLEETL